MDDLSDNLQQIVRLLGQMTDVFTSDAVIEDMQNVLSQLMNVSSAIMSMAYSLGNASVQLEDTSDTDDDDEALCLIAQCANTASITADTNVGGIAGNVSLDISFDREDQLNISPRWLAAGNMRFLRAFRPAKTALPSRPPSPAPAVSPDEWITVSRSAAPRSVR